MCADDKWLNLSVLLNDNYKELDGLNIYICGVEGYNSRIEDIIYVGDCTTRVTRSYQTFILLFDEESKPRIIDYNDATKYMIAPCGSNDKYTSRWKIRFIEPEC